MTPDATLAALFLAGLLGGVHCAGMCGGIVGALGLLDASPYRADGTAPGRSGPHVPVAALGRAMTAGPAAAAVPLPFPTVPSGGAASGGRVRARTPAASRRFARLLCYNAGRLSTYAALGAAAGTAGSFGWLLGEALPLQQIAYAASGLLLIATGAYVVGARTVVRALESLGGGLWRRVRPAATAALARAGTPAGAVAAGALWGLVPCGMVYAALAAALLSGDTGEGAALMLAFGLGTLPNLLLLGSGAERLARLTRHRAVRLAAGGTIALFGALALLRLDIAMEVPLLRELCVHVPGLGT